MVKCPKCKKELEMKYKDGSYGKNNKKYERVIYVCNTDDIWVSVEIPEEIIKNDN